MPRPGRRSSPKRSPHRGRYEESPASKPANLSREASEVIEESYDEYDDDDFEVRSHGPVERRLAPHTHARGL